MYVEVSRVQQHLRARDEGENRVMQERNDFLLPQIVTESRCFREARTNRPSAICPGAEWFLAWLVRRHPQLLVLPLRRVLHATTDSPPQSHRHSHIPPDLFLPTRFTAVSLPKRWPAMSFLSVVSACLLWRKTGEPTNVSVALDLTSGPFAGPNYASMAAVDLPV